MGSTTAPIPESTAHGGKAPDGWAFVILASANEPGRVGQRAPMRPREVATLGRGNQYTQPGRLQWFEWLPGENVLMPPLTDDAVSRNHATVRCMGDHVELEVLEKRRVTHNGRLVKQFAKLEEHDTVLLSRQLLLMLVRCPFKLPPRKYFVREHWGEHGRPNAHGFVWVSEKMWDALELLAEAATQKDVLLLGETGVGKELAAAMIHALSERRAGPWVTFNASLLTESLAAAQLSGMVANYLGHKHPENPGLFGAAQNGSFFLDEIGQLAHEQQRKLLRAMETDRMLLGDTRARPSHFGLIGATSEPPEKLLGDLRGRIQREITLPSLAERPEDIGVLVRHLADGAVVSPRIVEHLVLRAHPGNVRDLKKALDKARAFPERIEADSEPAVRPMPTVEEVKAALAKEPNNLAAAARLLGITRDELRSLRAKYGV